MVGAWTAFRGSSTDRRSFNRLSFEESPAMMTRFIAALVFAAVPFAPAFAQASIVIKFSHVVATGTPEQVAKVPGSYTGEFLAPVLANGRAHAYAGE